MRNTSRKKRPLGRSELQERDDRIFLVASEDRYAVEQYFNGLKFRRDEIWFAEKNEAGASHLYSLAEFKVRTDLKVDSGYLHGRFGAIPFLGGLDRLFPLPPVEKAAPEKRAKAAANS